MIMLIVSYNCRCKYKSIVMVLETALVLEIALNIKAKLVML